MRDQRVADGIARRKGAGAGRGDDGDVVDLGQRRQRRHVGRVGGHGAVVATGQAEGAAPTRQTRRFRVLRIGEQRVQQLPAVDRAAQAQRIQVLDLVGAAVGRGRHHRADEARMRAVQAQVVDGQAAAVGVGGDDGQRDQRGIGQRRCRGRHGIGGDAAVVGHGKPAGLALEQVVERPGAGAHDGADRRAVQHPLRRRRDDLARLDAAQVGLFVGGHGAVAAAPGKARDEADAVAVVLGRQCGTHAQVGTAGGAGRVAVGQVHPRHVQARAAFVEVGAHGMCQVVDGPRVGGAGHRQLQVGITAVDALEVGIAGQDLGQRFGAGHRALARGAGEGGGAGAHAFDGLGTKRGLFDIDAWGKVFGHGASPRAGRCAAIRCGRWRG